MKNLKSVVMNIALLVVGVLSLVFFTQPFYTERIMGSATGYDFAETEIFKGMSSNISAIKAGVIIGIVVLSIMMLVALVNLLVEFKVIKNAKIAKVLKFVTLVVVALVLIASIVTFAGAVSLAGEYNASLGWAAIVNLILAIGAAVMAVVALLGKKSK